MRRFHLCFYAVVLGLFLSVPSLNAQNKDSAGSKDKAKPAAAKTDAKAPAAAKPAAPAPKPVAEDKPLTQYKAWNIDADLEKRQDEFIKGLSGAANAERDKFFETYYFARWTDLKKQGEVQNYLSVFITKDLDPLNGNARDYLLRKSFEVLQKITADVSVNPTARYNAVLGIGHLTLARPRDRNSPPAAYAPALPYLVEQYNKADNPEYLKLGALLGIVRHCAMGIADENLKTGTVPNLLIKIITDGKPSAAGDKDTQYIRDFFRIRAVDGLASLGGGNSVSGNVVKGMKTFYDILENIEETADMRVRAARALGELNYKALGESAPPVPYEQAGAFLLNYAKRLSDNEIQIIEELQAKAKAEAGGVASYGSDTGGMSGSARTGTAAGQVNTGPPFDSLPVEKKLEVINVFQRIKSEFADIMFGIRGSRISASKKVEAGVQSAIPENSPAVAKLNKTAAAAMTLFRYLDEKDEQAKKLEKAREDKKKASGGSSMGSMPPDEMSMGSSGMGMSGGANADADKNMDIKPLKVNLGDILEALKTFSSDLDKIITAG